MSMISKISNCIPFGILCGMIYLVFAVIKATLHSLILLLMPSIENIYALVIYDEKCIVFNIFYFISTGIFIRYFMIFIFDKKSNRKYILILAIFNALTLFYIIRESMFNEVILNFRDTFITRKYGDIEYIIIWMIKVILYLNPIFIGLFYKYIQMINKMEIRK